MFIKRILYILLLSNTEAYKQYATPRWLQICNSTRIYNKTIVLRDFLKDNLDVLYL